MSDPDPISGLGGAGAEEADERIVVADVVTMDPAAPRAEALAMRDGRLVAVGTVAAAGAACAPGTPVERLDGATVVPGLIDAHLHLQWAGLKALRLLAPGEATVEAMLAAFDAAAFGLPWPEDEPVPTVEQRVAGLRLVQPLLHALGVTGAIDPAATAAEVAGYQEAQRRGELTMRVVAMPHPDLGAGDAAGVAAALERVGGLGVRTGLGDRRLRIGGIKAYFDGQGKLGTALLREPWPGAADGYRGEQRIATDAFATLAAFCARERWSLGVHVVGGGGIGAVLDAFAAADRIAPIGDLRFQLIHAYLEPTADDMALARRLGVVASVQPSIQWTNGTGLVERLGARATAATPLRSWLDAGVAVAGGSDGPDFPLDPRLLLAQARTRAVAGAEEPIGPEQTIAAEEALALLTTGAAFASFADHERGMLRAGLLADWTALSVDPTRCSPEELRAARTVRTVVGGRTVYADGAA